MVLFSISLQLSKSNASLWEHGCSIKARENTSGFVSEKKKEKPQLSPSSFLQHWPWHTSIYIIVFIPFLMSGLLFCSNLFPFPASPHCTHTRSFINSVCECGEWRLNTWHLWKHLSGRNHYWGDFSWHYPSTVPFFLLFQSTSKTGPWLNQTHGIEGTTHFVEMNDRTARHCNSHPSSVRTSSKEMRKKFERKKRPGGKKGREERRKGKHTHAFWRSFWISSIFTQ